MKKIEDKLEIKNKKLNSRIVLPAMAINLAKNGTVTDSLLEYYKSIIANKLIGIVITEHMYVSEEGKGGPNNISISKDEDIENVEKIANLCHEFNTICLAQINHCGGKAISELPTVGPSTIIPPSKRRKIEIIPKPLEKNEIINLIHKFVSSSLRAKEAEFDGIELHVAHGYLLNEFYSPLTNNRLDEYGGSLENRCKIILDITKEIRMACGNEFIIAIKLGVSDFEDGGITVQDTINALKLFDFNSIDIIEISGGLCGTNIPDKTKKILFLNELSEIRNDETVSNKFIYCLTGGITEYDEAIRIVSSDESDLIGIGRAMLTNRNWAFDTIKYEKER